MDQIEEALSALRDTSDRLIDAVEDLSHRIDATERIQADLSSQQEALREEQVATQKQRSFNILLATSLVLDFVLSVAIGFGAYKIDQHADEISALQDVVKSEVFCPLYELLVDAVNNPDPGSVDTPDERAAMERARVAILRGYEALNCDEGSDPPE